MRTLLAAFAAFAVVTAAGAQSTMVDEPDYVADEPAAVRDGFAVVRLLDRPIGEEDRRIVDEKFAGPVARAIDPAMPYGFSYAKLDLDGDGYQELVLSMRMAADTGGWGAATYVYRYDGKDWTLKLADQAMLVAWKPASGRPADLALVDPEGYRIFVDGGAGYVEAGRGDPSDP